MKIDTQARIKNLFGEPVNGVTPYQCENCGHIGQAADPLLLGRCLFNILDQPDAKLTEEMAYNRHRLLTKLASKGEIDIDTEDKDLVLQLAVARLRPSIYGTIRQMLEEADASAEKTKKKK